MGLETAAILGLSGVASAGLGMAGASISAEGARDVNSAQIKASKELQEDAQQYNSDMYARQLADSRENYKTQLADSRVNYQMQRQDQENFYNKYLSASGMSSQLQKAGINPGSYFGAGKGISQPAAMPTVSPTELGTPAAPSSPLASVGSLMNPMAAYGAVLPQIAGSIKDIASAAQYSASAKETQTLLEQKLYKLIADTGGQEALNTQLQLENEILKAFGKKKAAAEIKDLTQSAFLKSMMGKTEDAKKDLLEIQKMIGNEDLKIKSEEALRIAQLLNKQLNFVDEQIATEKSKQSANYASASSSYASSSYFDALTATENALRSNRVESASLKNDLDTIQKFLMGNELAVSDSTYVQRADALLQEFYRQGIMSKQAWFDYQQAKKWDDKQRFVNYLGNVVGMVNQSIQSTSGVYGQFTNRQRANAQDKFNELYGQSQHGTRTNYVPDEGGYFRPVWRQEW